MSEEEEWAALPLPDQFAHKNWKARKNGYEAAAKAFKTAQPDADIVREFLYDSNLWKAAVADSNVAAQQEALNAYNAFLDAAGTDGARRTRASTVAGAVEKGLVGRPAAKASAQESLMLLVELDKADPVVEELLPFLSHKQPKVIAATLGALKEMVRAYGCKVVNPKPVVTLLPKAFAHADKNVRAEGQGLTVELYRWLREAMKPLFWNELKEVQQKDLEKLFEPIRSEPTPKQERLLRSQQAAQEEAADAGGGGGEEGAGDDEDGGEIDLEPEYEAVDVFAKIPKDLNDRLASTKWKDRKEVLDEVYVAVNVPAMQEGPFDDVLRGCAKSMKDANIAVVTVAANVVECIAKGLRKSFTKYRGTVLPPMLERFKEKKTAVVDAISAACDAVFASAGLGEIESDVLEALKNKNPQVKEHTAKFIIRSLKTTREAPTLEQTKEFAEAGKKLAGESVAALRDAGAEILGVLWKIMGDRNMLSHLEGLDEIKKTKVKEFSDAAEVRTKWKPKSVAPPPAATSKAAPGKKPALGAKKAPAGAVKKAAAPKSTSPPPSDDSAPLQPLPTTRPGAPAAKGPAGLRPPGAGLRAPGSGLAKPGSGLKAPATSGTASPKRPTAPPHSDPDTSAAAPRPAGRGLAGRPLGKPALSAPASPPPPSRSESSSALSSIERQELHDLRAESDLLRNQIMELRQDKLKLTSTIAELQNQNAQLIEDHTRDILQIKAKETQLVRARSDAENAEDRANSLSKEIDRLKREMSRLGRAQGHQSNRSLDLGSAGPNGDAADMVARPTYGASRSFNVPVSATRRDVVSPDNGGMGSGGGGGGEGKENYPDGCAPNAKLSGMMPPAHVDRPPLQTSYTSSSYLTRPMSNGAGSGRATPGSQDGDGGRSVSGGSGAGDGVESWRRAAEVTQNLKARIEMMKARQNIGRGQ